MKKTTTILLNKMGADIQYSDEGGAFALAEAVVYELGKGVRRAFAAQSLEYPWPINLSVVQDEPGEEWDIPAETYASIKEAEVSQFHPVFVLMAEDLRKRVVKARRFQEDCQNNAFEPRHLVIRHKGEKFLRAFSEELIVETSPGEEKAFFAQIQIFGQKPPVFSTSSQSRWFDLEHADEWGKFFPDVQQLIPVSESEDLSKICGEDTVLRVHLEAMLEELEDIIRHKID